MARHTALFARVARIERARRPRVLPKLVYKLFDHDSAVEGVSGPSGAIVARAPNEALAGLYQRAWSIIGGVAMWATYPQAIGDMPEELPASAFAHRQPEPKPEPEPVDNWSDLAGIGRAATREELERWGVIAIPPERLM